MTIHRFLLKTALGPEEIERLVTAYHQTLRALDLTNRDDSITRMIAKKLIETMEWITDDRLAKAAFKRVVRSVQTQIELEWAVSRMLSNAGSASPRRP